MSTPIQHWTIYHAASGTIRRSGYGPPGSADLQALQTDEAITPQQSQPDMNMVDTSGPHPVIKPNPTYEP